MGGSKKVTVGYKYYVGLHFVLCHGPVDFIRKIRVDERVAWSGKAEGGSITINNPEMFGGEKREGGISGVVDINMGRPTQGQNSYLASVLGPTVPAYRGVVSAILNKCYIGNNPYLKKWSFETQRVLTKTDGTPQWNIERAAIPCGIAFDDAALWISFDLSGSMEQDDVDALKTGATNLLNDLQENQTNKPSKIHLRAFNDTIVSDFELDPIRTDADWDAARAHIAGYTINPGSLTDFDQAFTGTTSFYNGASEENKVMLFMSDGLPTTGGDGQFNAAYLHSIGVRVHCINLLQSDLSAVIPLDNTPEDGIPNAQSVEDIRFYSLNAFMLGADMNPAHVIHECLTNSEWGMGYQESDINDFSFLYASNVFFKEQIGLSLLWDAAVDLESFIGEVLRHVDCALSVSRDLGQFVLTPIRNDYDVGTLLLLDESNIVSVSDPNRVSFGELSNSVTVKYWNCILQREDSVTVSDSALILEQDGQNINATVEYRGITTTKNALIAAARDLKALSSPLLSCTIITNAVIDDSTFRVGKTFLWSWPDWKISNKVMRISKINYGDGVNNNTRVVCTEDVYSSTIFTTVSKSGAAWVDPSQPPENTTDVIAGELPYIELVKFIGQSETDQQISQEPALGYVFGAIAKPLYAINSTLFTDSGGGYQDVNVMDFSPHGKLSLNSNPTQTTISLTLGTDLEDVAIGSYCQIGEGPIQQEFARVDAVNPVTGAVTLGRGCYDAPPKSHSAGVSVFFWEEFSSFDEIQYVSGEVVNVKMTPLSTLSAIPIEDAEQVSVTLDQRANRPYAPGDFRVNGDSYNEELADGVLTLTWVGRDRLQQTSATIFDHTAGNIGPEAGTTYRVRGYVDGVLDHTEEPAVSGTTWTPSGLGVIRTEVHSIRDGLYSYQPAAHEFINVDAILLVTEGHANSLRETEEGSIRAIE